MSKHKKFVSITIFFVCVFFAASQAVRAEDTNLLSDLEAARAKYGATISHEQAAKILDTVAWNHKNENWGLLSKPDGNNCPVGSTPVACDILINKDSGIIYDVFNDSPGICNGISVAAPSKPQWNANDLNTDDVSRWMAPIDPSGVSDGMGDDVVLPDIIVCEEDGSFPTQPATAPPTKGLPTDLGALIEQIFTWSLGVLGISVFVMFFYSGFLWLTAAGNTARIGEARNHMTNAVFGAILLLSSYLILYTINPDFVRNTVNLPGLGTKKPSGGNTEGSNTTTTCDSGFLKYGNKKAGEVCHIDLVIPFSQIPPETECAGPDLACTNLKCQISGTPCNTDSDCPLNPGYSPPAKDQTSKDYCGGVCQQSCSNSHSNVPGVNQ